MTSDTQAAQRDPVELVVGGMSCGSCAARIERRLSKLDGVTATVNYATGRAYVTSTGGREPDELIGVIESCGYTATLFAGITMSASSLIVTGNSLRLRRFHASRPPAARGPGR